jgi:N-acetylglucosamine-6-sulfatase
VIRAPAAGAPGRGRRRLALTATLVASLSPALAPPASAQRAPDRPRNIVFILSDDHRYDFMGFHPAAPAFLETPALDRMAREGAHLANAFVNTSLCSPSRASILTGRYPLEHGVIDNQSSLRPGETFFPGILQSAGYATAFVGKWHMGEHSDEPQPGFDHWVSFQGQGVYFDPTLNVDGERGAVEGYTTDILTDRAIAWLDRVKDGEKPFFLYLSHKAVHAEFEPAPRHRDRYAGTPIPYPETMAATEANYAGKPRWVREQRSSWHGVDYLYHGQMTFDAFYRRYAETLLALDESVGRVLDYLEQEGLAESTLVVYMSDNGFLLGEHGLIDKRNAYEESIRIPMLAWAPGTIEAGRTIEEMVLNVDMAPTFLDLASVEVPERMAGRSLVPLLVGEPSEWREEMLYVYYWEYPFPHTPTVLAVRDPRYKYIFYHGIWDTNELYDVASDPRETRNLIADPAYEAIAKELKDRLFDRLEAADGMKVPFQRPGDWQAAERGPP